MFSVYSRHLGISVDFFFSLSSLSFRKNSLPLQKHKHKNKNMKKIALICMMVMIAMTSHAQVTTENDEQNAPLRLEHESDPSVEAVQQQAEPLKYGYLSYNTALQSMPEYAEMEKNMEQLRSQYEAEQKRVEDDFNKKYEDFLDGQASFPKTILQKRQSELQEILDHNIAFKKESLQLLAQAKKELMDALEVKLNAVLMIIGKERGYAFILNTDNNAVPFINPAQGEDINIDVKLELNK